MIRFEDYLQKLGLTEELIGRVMAVAKPFTARSNQRLLSPPQTCDRVFFIEAGVFREYKDLETETKTETKTETETDTEKTSWLLGEGNWLYSVESYITAKPAEYYLQALTKTAKLPPWASLTIRNVPKVLLGIHPNPINDKYIQNYLDEFCCKFNRKYFDDKLSERLPNVAISISLF